MVIPIMMLINNTYVAPMMRKCSSCSINLKLSMAVRFPSKRSTSPEIQEKLSYSNVEF